MGKRKIKQNKGKAAVNKEVKASKKPFIITGVIMVLLVAVISGLAIWANHKPKYLTGKHYVEISVKDYGIIQLELDADAAPITVTHFMELVKSGFYDGLTFHRVMRDFVIQGGDPSGTGDGQEGLKTIKGEFAQNGVRNNISHTRGTVSMARRGDDYDSATSQFFIVHKTDTNLNGKYAAFGHVISGMEVVDTICEQVKTTDPNGYVEKEQQPVIEYIKVIEKPETTDETE